MYTLKEIEEEIENDLKEKNIADLQEIIQYLKKNCKEILDTQDINVACEKIKNIRKNYKNTQSLPLWFRKLVFLVIYEYLVPMYEKIEREKLDGKNFQETKAIKQKYKRQTQLLKDMGLVKDIFRKIHWNMCSPDMKARQKVYISMNLPLQYTEVECNDIYRAMIHHMVCYAKVPTATFVDVYGKFGLPALFCANGYEHEIWVKDKKTLTIWKEIMTSKSSRVLVYQKIKEIQDILKKRTLDMQRKFISKLLQKYWLNTLLNIGSREEELDKITFVTEMFVTKSLEPEYWKEENLIIKNGEITGWLDEKKISKERIQKFICMTKKEFIYFAEQYRKIKIIDSDTNLESEKEDNHKLLYIDAPKYMREYVRENFDSIRHMDIVKLLQEYDGEWIFVWKNYIAKSYPTGHEKSLLNDRYKKIWEYEQEAQERIEDILKEDKKTFDTYDILREIKKIDIKSKKTLYVFKYRQEKTNSLKDIVFITNIQFPRIKSEDFFNKYFTKNDAKGALVRETYSNFYRYTTNSSELT